jgi:hypothetical protein
VYLVRKLTYIVQDVYPDTQIRRSFWWYDFLIYFHAAVTVCWGKKGQVLRGQWHLDAAGESDSAVEDVDFCSCYDLLVILS